MIDHVPGTAEWQIEFPEDWEADAELYEAKGWVPLNVRIGEQRRRVQFYDPIRLAQDIENELGQRGYFSEGVLVVVHAVTKQNIEAAVARSMQTVEQEKAGTPAILAADRVKARS